MIGCEARVLSRTEAEQRQGRGRMTKWSWFQLALFGLMCLLFGLGVGHYVGRTGAESTTAAGLPTITSEMRRRDALLDAAFMAGYRQCREDPENDCYEKDRALRECTSRLLTGRPPTMPRHP